MTITKSIGSTIALPAGAADNAVMGRQQKASSKGVVRLSIDRDAKADLEQFAESALISQAHVLSRLVKWFVKQDRDLQLTLLSPMPDEAIPAVAEAILKRMRGKKG